MKNELLSKRNQNKPLNPDEALKATSLLYLKEALIKEDYEECAQLIVAAKNFGAGQEDIRSVIEEHIRVIQKHQHKEAAGSRRF